MSFIVATGPAVAENRSGYFIKIARWEPKNNFAKVSVKLAVWKNNEVKRCNSANAGSNSSIQTMPPPFNEIGKPSNTPSSSATSSNRPIEIDNRCIQDGGTQMCYDSQSQRYGNN